MSAILDKTLTVNSSTGFKPFAMKFGVLDDHCKELMSTTFGVFRVKPLGVNERGNLTENDVISRKPLNLLCQNWYQKLPWDAMKPAMRLKSP